MKERIVNIKKLLEDELDCFNHILRETNRFINDLDSVTIEAILQLLDEREKHINLINDIEQIYQQEIQYNSGSNAEHILNEISNVSKKIIALDARVMEIVHIMKSEVLSELNTLINRNSPLEIRQNTATKPIIDILQK
ncbi:MAG: hypothetical protein ACE5D8_02025 [Fidelibacterota bacterium]